MPQSNKSRVLRTLTEIMMNPSETTANKLKAIELYERLTDRKQKTSDNDEMNAALSKFGLKSNGKSA